MADHGTNPDGLDHDAAAVSPPPSRPGVDPEARARAKRVVIGLLGFLLVAVVVLVVVLVSRPAGRKTPPPLPDLTRLASPDFPIDQGKALVLVLAMDCDHCILAAQQTATFDAKAYGLNVYCLLYGQPEDVDAFFAEVGAQFPYRMATAQEYADFAGDDPPAVYLLRNGKTQAMWISCRYELPALRTELARER